MLRGSRFTPKQQQAFAALYKATGFRSRFEIAVAEDLQSRGQDYEYETLALPYVVEAIYKPDFIFRKQCFVVEAKGLFTPEDRTKMLLIQQQHPDLDIRLLFQRSANKLYKGSKSTYGSWAEKHGFIFAEKFIPQEWFNHKPKKKQREAYERLTRDGTVKS